MDDRDLHADSAAAVDHGIARLEIEIALVERDELRVAALKLATSGGMVMALALVTAQVGGDAASLLAIPWMVVAVLLVVAALLVLCERRPSVDRFP